MAIRKPEIRESGYYFITFTCFKWLRLFELANAYELIYKWFDYLASHNHRIIAYVIMPNHIHLLLAYRQADQSLNKLIGNGKRFLAYGIVKNLQQIEATDTLQLLKQGVNDSDRKRNKVHQVFEDSFEVKLCISQKFLLQKLTYIHNNPCSGKWMFADNAINYKHSSASYYVPDKAGTYPVTTWMELEADGWWDQQLPLMCASPEGETRAGRDASYKNKVRPAGLYSFNKFYNLVSLRLITSLPVWMEMK